MRASCSIEALAVTSGALPGHTVVDVLSPAWRE